MASLGDLMVRVGADVADLNSGLSEASGKISEFANHSLEALAAVAESFAFEKIGESLLKAGEDFEKAGFTFQKVAGATGETLHGLEDSFASLYVKSSQSSEGLATALAQLSIRTGATGEDLENLAGSFGKLTKVLGGDLNENIQVSERLFKQWGVDVEDQKGKMDVLATITQKTGISFQTLAQEMTAFGPVLRGLGFDFDQSAALLGKFDSSGLGTQQIMRALGSALTELTGKFADPEAALRLLIERMAVAPDKFEAVRIAMAEGLTQRGALPLADAIQKGAFAIDDLVKAAKNSSGTLDSIASQTGSLSGEWTKFQHALEKAIEPLGKDLISALRDALDAIKPLAGMLGDSVKWFEALPGPLKTTVEAVAAIVAVAPGVVLALKGVSTAWEALSAAGALPNIKNLASTLKNDLIPALTSAEPALLSFGTVVSLAGAAFVGWELGKLLDQIPAVHNFAQKIADEFGGVKDSEEQVQQATADMLKNLQKMGVDVELGPNLSVAQYNKIVTDAARAAGLLGGAVDQASGSLKDHAAAAEKAQAASAALHAQYNSGKITIEQYRAGLEAIAKQLSPSTEAAAKAAAEASQALAAAYSALGIESNKVRDVEAALALVYRTNTTDTLPKTITGYQALATAYASGKITLDQFRTSLISVGEQLVKGLPADKLVDDLKNLATIVPLKSVSEDFKTLGVVSQAALDKLASDSQKAYNSILTDGQSTARDIQRAWIAMIDNQVAAGKILTQEEVEKYQHIKEALLNTVDSLGGVGTAFKELGVVSDATLKKIAEDAAVNFEIVSHDADSTTHDIQVSWLSMIDKQVAAGKVLTQAELDKYQQIKQEATRTVDAINEAFKTLGITSDAQFQQLAEKATNAYVTIATNANSTTHDIQTAWLAMVDANVKAGVTLTQETRNQYEDLKREVSRSVDSINTDFKTLGVTSSAQLDKLAADAKAAYERIANDADSSDSDIQQSWLRMIERQIDAGEQLSLATQLQYVKIKATVDEGTGNWIKDIQSINKVIDSDLSKALGDVIFQTGKIGDAFVKLGKDVTDIILNHLVKEAMTPLLEQFDKLIGKIGGALSTAITDCWGNMSKGIKDAVDGIGVLDKSIAQTSDDLSKLSSIGGPGGSAPGGAPGAPSDPTGGAAGAIGSSLTGWLGAIGSIATAITGVISIFQNMHQETSLNAIEHNTRYSMMYLGERADGGILGVLFKVQEDLQFGTITKKIEAMSNEFVNHYSETSITKLTEISSNTFWSMKKLDEINGKIGKGTTSATDTAQLGALDWMKTALGNINTTLQFNVGLSPWFQTAFQNMNNGIVACAGWLQGISDMFSSGAAKVGGGSSGTAPAADSFTSLAGFVNSQFSTLYGWLGAAFKPLLTVFGGQNLTVAPGLPALPTFTGSTASAAIAAAAGTSFDLVGFETFLSGKFARLDTGFASLGVKLDALTSLDSVKLDQLIAATRLTVSIPSAVGVPTLAGAGAGSTAQITSSGGGDTYHIHISGNKFLGNDTTKLAQAVGDELIQHMRRRGRTIG